jgi:hypothetical protein
MSDVDDGVTVLGLIRNDTDIPASSIEVRVSLGLRSTNLIDQQMTILPISLLQPSEEFPFTLAFPDTAQADQVEIIVMDYQSSAETDIKLEVEISGVGRTESGQFAILGWLSNPHSSSAQIHNSLLVYSDPETDILTFKSPDLHPSTIPPSQKVPFMTILEQDPTELSITPYFDATALDPLGNLSISFPQRATIAVDSQGNPLLVGSIRNEGTLPRWLSCIVALQSQDQLVSLSQLAPPIPLTAGEIRAYGLTHFPGWRTHFIENELKVEDIHSDFFCDPLAYAEFSGQIFTLDSEVVGFEVTGSSLIIRGEVYNRTSHPLSNAVIQADLRSVDGTIQTSNFILLDEMLEIGSTSTFILPVRLPEGSLLSKLEIDVRANALLLESDLDF